VLIRNEWGYHLIFSDVHFVEVYKAPGHAMPIGANVRLGIAIPGSRKPVYRDPARFFNTEIPVLRWSNTETFGIGVIPKRHIQKRFKNC
jgi:hypothetical protein